MGRWRSIISRSSGVDKVRVTDSMSGSVGMIMLEMERDIVVIVVLSLQGCCWVGRSLLCPRYDVVVVVRRKICVRGKICESRAFLNNKNIFHNRKKTLQKSTMAKS